jgi:cytoskeleton protein RodZ
MSAGPGSHPGASEETDSAIGAQLRAARTRQQLNIEQVAKELHLDPEIILAIERDDQSSLPAPIFVQGYLRSYARLVGVPEDSLIRKYNAQCAEPPPLSVIRPDTRLPLFQLPSARLIRNVILALLGVILLWMAYPLAERFIMTRGDDAAEQVPGRIELPAFEHRRPSDPTR